MVIPFSYLISYFVYFVILLPELLISLVILHSLRKKKKLYMFLAMLFISLVFVFYNGRLWNEWMILESGAGTDHYLFINRGYPIPYRGVANFKPPFPYTDFTDNLFLPLRFRDFYNITNLLLLVLNFIVIFLLIYGVYILFVRIRKIER